MVDLKNIKEDMLLISMDKENILLMMDLNMMDNGKIIRSMELVNIYGQIKGSLGDNGKKIKWMGLVFINGQTVNNSILVNIKKVLNMDMESFDSQTDQFFLDFGKMGKGTV